MCMLENLEYLSILFCAVLWAATPVLVAIITIIIHGLIIVTFNVRNVAGSLYKVTAGVNKNYIQTEKY